MENYNSDQEDHQQICEMLSIHPSFGKHLNLAPQKIVSSTQNFRRSPWLRTAESNNPAMKGLKAQRFLSGYGYKRWTCSNCLRQQFRPLSSSVASPIPDFPTDSQPKTDLEESSETVEGGEAGRPAAAKPVRRHLKNYGQYFVTTPIFYVNGGLIPGYHGSLQIHMSDTCTPWSWPISISAINPFGTRRRY